MSKTLRVDLKEILNRYPLSEYPALDFCKEELNLNPKMPNRVEIWNYERDPPEADFIVLDVRKYTKNPKQTKKRRVRHIKSHLG